MDTSSSSLPVIEVDARLESGTSANNRIRSQGLIPGVVYHRGEQSLNVVVSGREFLKIASTSRSSQVFSLHSKDSRIDGRTALVKQIAKDYVSGKVLHVDFQSLKENEEIVVDIPLKIQGEAYGVKTEGGILTVSVHEVSVRCLPRQIPSELVIDVTELHLGKSIHAGDLPLPAGVTLENDPEETVVSVVAIRAVEEAAPAAEVAAEGAAAEGEAAAATADAGADKKKEKK